MAATLPSAEQCGGSCNAGWTIYEGLAAQYLSEYRRIVGAFSGDYERAEQALADGMSVEDFDQRKARTNAALSQALGAQLAASYLIQADGTRPRTRYRLRLEPEAIRFGTIDEDGEEDVDA